MIKKIIGCLVVPYVMLGILLYKNNWKKLGILVAGVPSLMILIISIAIVTPAKELNYESSKIIETVKPKTTTTAKPTIKPTEKPKETIKPTIKPTATTKPTVKPTVKPKIESKIEKQIKVLETSFKGIAEIKHDKKENIIKIIPKDKNFMKEVLGAANGNKIALEEWVNLKQSIINISMQLDSSLSLSNNLNKEKELLIVYRGIVLYDVVEGG